MNIFFTTLLFTFGLEGAASFFEAFEGRRANMNEFRLLQPEGVNATFHSAITPPIGLQLTYSSPAERR